MPETERRTVTAEERLAELGRRIDILGARAETGSRQAAAWIEPRVAALRAEEASARTAVRSAAASIEETTRALEAKADLAEHAVAADLADNADEFFGASTEELQSWDVYLERLQVKVATTAGNRRDEAEGSIAELRRYRHGLAARLHEVPLTSAEAWREVRERVRAARDGLESRVAELEATLAQGGEG